VKFYICVRTLVIGLCVCMCEAAMCTQCSFQPVCTQLSNCWHRKFSKLYAYFPVQLMLRPVKTTLKIKRIFSSLFQKFSVFFYNL